MKTAAAVNTRTRVLGYLFASSVSIQDLGFIFRLDRLRLVRELRTEIEIGAGPERVWAVLIDFGAYPDWNPFIRRITGQPAVGSRLEARIEPPDSRAMTFKPTVIRAEPNRELAWLGRLGLPGIFDGEHHFEIHPRDGGTSFVHREEFRGVLAPLFGRQLEKTKRGFEEMNAALKQRVESAPQAET